jgi:transcriptional regulator with XRE-family HTH domain
MLGGNLRTARLRRDLTINEAAEKIGTGSRAVSDAERGKPSTGSRSILPSSGFTICSEHLKIWPTR